MEKATQLPPTQVTLLFRHFPLQCLRFVFICLSWEYLCWNTGKMSAQQCNGLRDSLPPSACSIAQAEICN